MPVLEQVLEKYPQDVKLVFKNFPLKNHSFARPAAIAALAASNQGKFWEFHDLLFKHYSQLNEQQFQRIARDLNLDMDKFEKDQKDPTIQTMIAKDVSEGNKAGVRGTPTVFINGRRLKARNLAGFQALIDKELEKVSERRNR
ncbi:MAG: thioredoxin domain-containing protein [Deltaproteobacteria bacterium]|nr:MAG: thioredoxin domain-containing protein [Deltaproteobacteria bacterium]